MAGIAGAGMHHQPGRLVDHQAVPVLVHDMQRDRLRLGLPVRHGRRDLDGDPGAGLYPVGRTGGSPRDPHCAGLDPALDARAGLLRQQPRQHDIEPLPGHFRRDLQFNQLELCAHRGTRS